MLQTYRAVVFTRVPATHRLLQKARFTEEEAWQAGVNGHHASLEKARQVEFIFGRMDQKLQWVARVTGVEENPWNERPGPVVDFKISEHGVPVPIQEMVDRSEPIGGFRGLRYITVYVDPEEGRASYEFGWPLLGPPSLGTVERLDTANRTGQGVAHA